MTLEINITPPTITAIDKSWDHIVSLLHRGFVVMYYDKDDTVAVCYRRVHNNDTWIRLYDINEVPSLLKCGYALRMNELGKLFILQ